MIKHSDGVYTVIEDGYPVADCASRRDAEAIEQWMAPRMEAAIAERRTWSADDLHALTLRIGADARRAFGHT